MIFVLEVEDEFLEAEFWRKDSIGRWLRDWRAARLWRFMWLVRLRGKCCYDYLILMELGSVFA